MQNLKVGIELIKNYRKLQLIFCPWFGFFILFFILFAFSIFLLNLEPLIKIFPEIKVFSEFISSGNLFHVRFLFLWFILLIFLTLLVWLSIRYITKFKDNEIGIIIAFAKIDQKADADLEALNMKLQNIIDSQKYSANIKIKSLPEWKKVRSLKDAEKVREKLRAKLIIWGDVNYGRINEEESMMIEPIHFSYIVNLPTNEAATVNNSFKHLLKNKKWVITQNNSLIDREYLTNNIREVSLHIIATLLYFAGKDRECFEIFKDLIDKYKETPHHTIDEEIIQYNIFIVLGAIHSQRFSRLQLSPTSKNISDDLESAKKLFFDFQNYKEFEDRNLLLKSQISFAEKRDIVTSLQCAHQAYSINKDLGAIISLTFLYYYKGDLINGLKWLNLSLKHKNNKSFRAQSISIVMWYENSLKEDNTKKYLYFPLGMFYYAVIKDKKIAKECILCFLEEFENKPEKYFKNMIWHSKKIIKKIKRQA